MTLDQRGLTLTNTKESNAGMRFEIDCRRVRQEGRSGHLVGHVFDTFLYLGDVNYKVSGGGRGRCHGNARRGDAWSDTHPGIRRPRPFCSFRQRRLNVPFSEYISEVGGRVSLFMSISGDSRAHNRWGCMRLRQVYSLHLLKYGKVKRVAYLSDIPYTFCHRSR